MTQEQANRIQTIEQLPSQMAQFLQLLDAFQQTLLSESEALKSNLTNQLATTLLTKEKLAKDISLLTQSIEARLKTKQLTLSVLLSTQLPSNLPLSMQQDIQHIITLSNQCHDLNQANGISIQILNNINQHALNTISGQEAPNIKLYSASGETQTPESIKKTLGKA
ncbi:hypothetical protein MNBD_GAMMA04-1372 [hydrothermal vent metagenome]|uniref:Flagellar protein FlgN n=1 Tax=hydrothermal vent metagenome TaxID=652676 RepID=A0A3B0W810_9ZZZZ